VVSFSAIGDDDRLHDNIDPDQAPVREYGCGLFGFTRKNSRMRQE
jgi:hypothetical protein